MSTRKRPRGAGTQDDDEGAQQVEERREHHEASSRSRSPMIMRDEMDRFAEELEQEGESRSEGHEGSRAGSDSSGSDSTFLTRYFETTNRGNATNASPSCTGNRSPRTAEPSAVSWRHSCRETDSGTAAERSSDTSTTSNISSRRSVVAASGSAEPSRNHAAFIENNWNFIISTYRWVDRDQFEESRHSLRVYCKNCRQWLRATRQRDLSRHNNTHQQAQGSFKPTTLCDFMPTDAQAKQRAQQLVTLRLAALGLSMRTIEQVLSPDMVTLMSKSGAVSRKKATRSVKRHDMADYKIARLLRNKYLSLYIDDAKDDTTGKQLSVLQASTLSLSSPVTLAVSCHRQHSTIESLRNWIPTALFDFQGIQDENIVSVVTDNGAPVVGAAKALVEEKFTTAERIPCLNHGLHLVTESFLNKFEDAYLAAYGLKAWIEGRDYETKRYFLRDIKNFQALRFSPNRWGSTLEAILTMSEQWDYIKDGVDDYVNSLSTTSNNRIHHGVWELQSTPKFVFKAISNVMQGVPDTIKIAQTVHPPIQQLCSRLCGIKDVLSQFSDSVDESKRNLMEDIADARSQPGFSKTAERLQRAASDALAKFKDYVDPAITVLRKKEKCMKQIYAKDHTFRNELGFSRTVWSGLVHYSSIQPNCSNVEEAYHHWSDVLSTAASESDGDTQKLAKGVLRILSMGVSNATVERVFSQVKARTEDPQASHRSDDLTEGLVKAVANADLMSMLTVDVQKALPFVPPGEDPSAEESEDEVSE